MESLALGLRILSILLFSLLLIGLFKPWVVLWWEDTQYRLKVIKIYGIAALMTWLGSELIGFLKI